MLFDAVMWPYKDLKVILLFFVDSKNSVKEENKRHSYENADRSTAEDEDADDDQVEDLSMSRKSDPKISPPPSPVSVASVANCDAAVPAQTGVIVPPQK